MTVNLQNQPKKSKPLVMYRYEDKQDRDDFTQQFRNDFDFLFASSDDEGLSWLGQEDTIDAVFVDQKKIEKALQSPLFKAASELHPRSLKVLLNTDIALEAVIKLLTSQVIDKCFAKPFDSNVIRSNVFSAAMGLRESSGAALQESTQVPSVLLVDDEPLATKYLKNQIDKRNCNFSVLCAESATEALSLLQEHKAGIAVIISDQKMPGMNGDQLLNRIRNMQPNIIRILTSAFGEVDVALNAVNQGRIFQYLKKPWDANEVIDCINSALAEHRTLTQNFRRKNSSIEKEHAEIIARRRIAITTALSPQLQRIGRSKALAQFFDCLSKIEVLAPNLSSNLASLETDLEADLVTAFREEVAGHLKRFPETIEGVDKATVGQLHALLQELSQGNNAKASIRAAGIQCELKSLAEELTHALAILLTSSGIEPYELVVGKNPARFEVSLSAGKSFRLYQHVAGPLARVSRPLILQQSAMLILFVISNYLSGELAITGGRQSFTFTLSIG